METTKLTRLIIGLSLGLTMALALTSLMATGIVLGAPVLDDQPDGSNIVSPQTTSGTWGPGVITATSNIVINPGVVIAIAPGTTIRVAGNYGFAVNGDLHSNGPVTFTAVSATPGAWQGITYTAGSRGYLNQATVEYAQHAIVLSTTNPITISYSILRYSRHAPASGQDAYGAGLVILAGNHLIDRTDIYSNTVVGTGSGAEAYGGGIDIQAGATQILNSRIYSNSVTSINSYGGGGGIVIRSNAAPLVQNSEVTTNTLDTRVNGTATPGAGGGIGIYGTTLAVIRTSLIAGNANLSYYAAGGGIGVSQDARAKLFDGNVIVGNRATATSHGEGGGIDAWSNNVFTMSNNLLYGNTARTQAGAVNVHGNAAAGDVNVINNTIVSNTAPSGGGLYRQQSGRVFNNIVVGNAATSGGGVYGSTGSAGYNDVWNNSVNNYNAAAPATDIQVNPLFLSTGNLVQQYHLRQDSPVIDAGANTGAGLPNADFDGEARPGYATWDMGFDEIVPNVADPFASLKKASPILTFFAAGEKIKYTVEVVNNQVSASSGSITDRVSLYTTYTTGPIVCNMGTCGYDSSTKAITWTGSIPSGGRLALDYTVVVDTPLPDGTAITNTATISMAGQIASTNLVTTTINNPVFALSKATVGAPIRGVPFDYQITARNNSTLGGATNVVVTDTLPAGANYVSGGTLVGGNTVSWTIPSIRPSDLVQVTFRISTCQASLVNQYYQVVTSTQKVRSAPGSPLTTNLAQPALAADFKRTPFILESAPTEINMGQTVYFTNTSTTNGSPITSWQWNFGDGFAASGTTASHAYTTPGIYTATLTVTDRCGLANTKAVSIRVYSPAFTVTKSATPEPVEPGQTLNYAIVIANNGQGDATGLVISDPLPAHTTYVPGSSQVTLPVLQSAIYRDELTSVIYTGTNGTVSWISRPWIEIGEANGPGSGDVVVTADQGDNSVRIQNSGRGLSRTVDLSSYPSAALIFEYRRNSFEATDYVSVEVSSNGGASWVALGVFTGTATDSAYRPIGYDISGYISSNTAIRFRASAGMDTSDQFYVDNVQIEGTAYQVTTNPAGTPPNLVSGVALNAGQSMTVTYAATVVKPLAGGTIIANTASVTSTQLPMPATGGTNNTVSNVPPVAVDDSASTVEETAVTISVLVNDGDANGDPLTIGAVGVPSHGTATMSGTITIVYTPSLNYNGADVFTYTASDGLASSNAAVVTVTVDLANDPPVFSSAPVTTATEGVAYVYGIIATDPDAGDVLTVTAPTRPAWLSFTDNGNGTAALNGTPTNLDVGNHAVTLHVRDRAGETGTQSFTITVSNVNETPTDISLSNSSVAENQPIGASISTLSTTDPDTGDTHTYSLAVGAGDVDNGAFSIEDNTLKTAMAFNYEAKNSYSIRVRATDNGGLYFEKQFTIAITDINEAPTISDIADQTTDEDTAVGPISFAVGDVDTPADDLTLSADSSNTALAPVANVILGGSGANRTVTITPAANQSGLAIITIAVSDGSLTASDAFTLTVNPANDQPVAHDDTYGIAEDTVLAVPAPGVLTNDSDADGDALTTIWLSAPSHGTLSLGADGSFVYTPTTDYHGPDSFAYKAHDSLVESNVATVTLNIHSGNDAPVAVNDSYSTIKATVLSVAVPGVLGNDTDADGDGLTAVYDSGPTHGALTLDSNGSFVYTPTADYVGPDSFAYMAFDNTANSYVCTVTIMINDPAPAPLEVKIYLPLIMRNAVVAPDLVVERIIATSNGAQVVIKNQGNAPVMDEFWVDLYVNPHPVPTGVNQTWNDGRCTQGIVWGVTTAALPIAPDGMITLTYGDDYYWPSLSSFGTLAAGTPIYVQVDSANVGTTFGAVRESHEIVNGTYNNVSGPVVSTLNVAGNPPLPPLANAGTRPATVPNHLPPRR